ncbi:MAG: flagellar protein FliS [Syntrophomonadaceae bacterium]|nr:flagellar protein FliS [Syntrophomonadaceae bacterium]
MNGNTSMLSVNCGPNIYVNEYSDKLFMIFFNSAMKNIENAISAIKEKNFNQAHIQLIIAQEMIAKWITSFPQEYLETINLAQNCEYLLSKLRDANIKKDLAVLMEIRNIMVILSNTYGDEEIASIASSLADSSLKTVFSETG